MYLTGDGVRTGVALTNPCLEMNSTKRQMVQNKRKKGSQSRKEGYCFVASLVPALSACNPLALAGDDWRTSNYHLGEEQYGVNYHQCAS